MSSFLEIGSLKTFFDISWIAGFLFLTCFRSFQILFFKLCSASWGIRQIQSWRSKVPNKLIFYILWILGNVTDRHKPVFLTLYSPNYLGKYKKISKHFQNILLRKTQHLKFAFFVGEWGIRVLFLFVFRQVENEILEIWSYKDLFSNGWT